MPIDMLADQLAEKSLEDVRKRLAPKLAPGQRVQVITHYQAGIEYDQVWIQNDPDRESEIASHSISAGQHAMIVSVLKTDETWILLLADDGRLGWTVEAEGLRVQNPRRKTR